MNGKVKGTIACGIVAAGLAGALVFLNPKDDNNNAAETSSELPAAESLVADESVLILEKGADEINSVKVTNENGSYTLKKKNELFRVEELGEISQDDYLTNGAIDCCGCMDAEKMVEENASDLEKYGLSTPRGTIEVSYTDGTSAKVEIGDVAYDENKTYVKTDSSNAVYMMNTATLTHFLEPATVFADLTLIPQPDENSWPEYGKEVITRNDWDYKAVFENDPGNNEGIVAAQVMTEPVFAYLNVTGSTDVTHGMWGLKASDCILPFPDEESLKEYGLDEPRCVVELSGEGYDYTLTVGSQAFDPDIPEGDTPVVLGYYCTLKGAEGCDAVYLIPTESLPWVTFKVEDVLSNLITANFVVDLKELSVEKNGTKTVYEITSNGSSADETPAELTKVTQDGKELDVQEFKKLFQYIITCPTTEICFDEPSGEPEYIITQTDNEGSTDVIELYKDSARRYIVKLGGKPSFRIPSTWTETLDENIESLKNGGKINENY